MGCHLVPYFHIALHQLESLKRNGPAYAAWCFASERHNGVLSRIKHNGHSGGELEGTLARGWMRMQLIHDMAGLCFSFLGSDNYS
ncbi:uncharacterized protein EI90DRAFT_2900822 [Cantharellus anzutake]|uniref:uncharacterized protein n=1 Tax=Cantharellus anzutake TaxID=1750568 RepID=UPI0019060AD9|nr:uncharacterized protein EI90DRAFT_2900822 [Cantharellus anzutake]KAF8343865.1 hypothetical protein EI90DRAFT_2900822 [Cantharellus anzutake]